MFAKLKRKSLFKALPIAIVLILLGLFVLVLESTDLQSLMRGPVEFTNLAPDEIEERMIVEATIDANFGSFAEEYEENTETHVTKTTDLYYVIWTGDENAEDWRYMGIKVDASEESAMEAMAEETYNYGYAAEPIEFAGAIDRMTDEEYEYFKEYFLESGFTEQEVEEYTLPYYINVGVLVGGSAVFTYVLIGIGAVLVLAGILRIVLAMNKSCKSIKKELDAAGIAVETAEYEYANAKVFSKAGDIRIGRDLLFYMDGKEAHAAACNQIVWAYLSTTAHHTNGMNTGTSYRITMYTYSKKLINANVGKEAVAHEILKYMNETMPWVVVGYSDELNRSFFSDYDNFLQLRYQSGNPNMF